MMAVTHDARRLGRRRQHWSWAPRRAGRAARAALAAAGRRCLAGWCRARAARAALAAAGRRCLAGWCRARAGSIGSISSSSASLLRRRLVRGRFRCAPATRVRVPSDSRSCGTLFVRAPGLAMSVYHRFLIVVVRAKVVEHDLSRDAPPPIVVLLGPPRSCTSRVLLVAETAALARARLAAAGGTSARGTALPLRVPTSLEISFHVSAPCTLTAAQSAASSSGVHGPFRTPSQAFHVSPQRRRESAPPWWAPPESRWRGVPADASCGRTTPCRDAAPS